jgi:hypothetical protein
MVNFGLKHKYFLLKGIYEDIKFLKFFPTKGLISIFVSKLLNNGIQFLEYLIALLAFLPIGILKIPINHSIPHNFPNLSIQK